MGNDARLESRFAAGSWIAAFNAWIRAVFFMISSFRSTGQDVMNAGVAVMLREISGRARNLQRILAGLHQRRQTVGA